MLALGVGAASSANAEGTKVVSAKAAAAQIPVIDKREMGFTTSYLEGYSADPASAQIKVPAENSEYADFTPSLKVAKRGRATKLRKA